MTHLIQRFAQNLICCEFYALTIVGMVKDLTEAALPNAAILFRLRSVSLAEIGDQIAGLTVEERLDVAALIAHLNRVDDPEYRSELDQRAADMDAGKKSTLDELERRHQRLATDGR